MPAAVTDSVPGSAGGRAVIGITGPPGAGKTYLVARLLEVLGSSPPDGLIAEAWVAQ